MNLMKDLREEGKSTPEKEFQEELFPPKPSSNEKITVSQPSAPLTSPAEEDEIPSYEKRKRRSGVPATIIAIVFLAAIVSAYFGFFRKGSKSTPSSSLATKVVSDSAAVPQKTDSSNKGQGQKTEEQPATTKPGTSDQLAGLGNVMSAITHAIPQGTRLNSLFLDDGVFSVEIEGSKQDLEKYQTELKAQLPGSATLNSSRSVSAGKALVSGTFPLVGATGTITAPTRQVVQKNLREMASKAGARILELSIGRSLVLRGTKKSPVYVKLSGDYSQFQSFYNDLIQNDWKMQVSKILIMSAAAGRANLVLRFFLINQE